MKAARTTSVEEMTWRGVLLEGESLRAAIRGQVESSRDPLGGTRSKHQDLDLATTMLGMDRRSRLLGLTNQRVIFYMPKIMNRYEFEAYAIEQVDSATFTKGMRKGRIDISIVNNNRMIKHIDNGEGRIMVDMIQSAVQESKKQGSAAASGAQSPMDALKMKLVDGEITEEEYERKRKILEG